MNESTESTSWPTEEVTPWPMFAVTPDTYQRFFVVANLIMSPLICTCGIIGNSIGIYIIRQDPDSRKLSIYTYLLSLMMSDIALLFVGVVANLDDFLTYMDIQKGDFLVRYCPMCKGYSIIVLKHVTAILLAVMSAERWMALAFPYSVKHFYLSKYPKLVITASILFSAIYIIPFFLGNESIITVNDKNETVIVNFVNKDYFPIFIVYTYIETILLHYIAPFIVIGFNILILVAYARFVKERSMLRSNMSDNQRKITLIVTCVAGFYILVSLPHTFVQTLIFVDDEYSFYGNHVSTFNFFIDLGDLLSRVNAAADIFLYVLVASRYRALINTIIKRNARPRLCIKEDSSSTTNKY